MRPSAEVRQAVGAWLKEARLAQRLSQDELAERACVAEATIVNVEAGRVGRTRFPQSIPALERALSLPVGVAQKAWETGQFTRPDQPLLRDDDPGLRRILELAQQYGLTPEATQRLLALRAEKLAAVDADVEEMARIIGGPVSGNGSAPSSN